MYFSWTEPLNVCVSRSPYCLFPTITFCYIVPICISPTGFCQYAFHSHRRWVFEFWGWLTCQLKLWIYKQKARCRQLPLSSDNNGLSSCVQSTSVISLDVTNAFVRLLLRGSVSLDGWNRSMCGAGLARRSLRTRLVVWDVMRVVVQ